MQDHEALVSSFQEITNCSDPTFAASFLEGHGWDLESSVSAFILGESASSGPMGNGTTTVGSSEDVRAPIPAMRDTLLDPRASFGGDGLAPPRPDRGPPRSIFEAFRDFMREGNILKHQERMESFIRRHPLAERKKLQTLADIFRPPFDLLFPGTFEEARLQSTRLKKWLLVNIQDMGEFATCQLNRDTWSSPELKKLIADNFVMIQTTKDSDDGRRYSVLYKLSAYPHVGLVDPRTGQLLRSWEGFVDATTFLTDFQFFLASNSLDDLSARPRKQQPKAKVDLTEEEMLAEAIAASLKETGSSAGDSTTKPKKKRKREIVIINDEEEEEEEEELDGQEVESDTSNGKGSCDPEKKRAKVNKITTTAPTTQREAESGIESEEQAPSEGTGPECIIQIRAMDGTTFSKTFREGDTLGAVRGWLVTNNRLGGSPPFALVTAFPRRTFGDEDLSATLQSLGLTPRAVIIIHPIG